MHSNRNSLSSRIDPQHERYGDKRVMFNENLEMEWCTWKETNLAQLIKDRFDDSAADACNNPIDNGCSKTPSSHDDAVFTDTSTRRERENVTTAVDENSSTDQFLNHLHNPHSKISLQFGPITSNLCLPIPKLSIVVMTVGTRGDIQPFCQLGLRLLSHGHRVRLATHECFREYVSSTGLEYYPLAGDPHRLSEFMVRTHGNIIPSMSDLIHEVPKNLAMVGEIINSCWGACVSSDPEDSESRPFIADAIISNPVTYGHIHCAEALGIPLHLMFPQVRALIAV
jgi:hypothetical protein